MLTLAPAPSVLESLGVCIAYSDPLVKVPRAGFLGILSSEIGSYEQEIAAVGGYLTARFDLGLRSNEAEDWFEDGLCRHIEVFAPDLSVVWEGFVNGVTISRGQYAASRGLVTDIANRVGAIYSRADTSTSPPVVIPNQITTLVEDFTSQNKYGIWEKWVSCGETDLTGAQRARDVFLRERAEPTADDPRLVLGGGGGQISVSVECVGSYSWLLASPYSDATSGTVTCQAKVQSVVAASPNRVFSYDYSMIGYNPDLAPRYEQSGTPAWEVLKALASRGDVNNKRWTLGVYASGVVYYQAIPDYDSYQHRLSDPAQRVETVVGGWVAPWNVLPARWLYIPDLLTGMSPPITDDDRSRDPRCVFIESVRYRAPYDVEITGAAAGRLAQILARQGVGAM